MWARKRKRKKNEGTLPKRTQRLSAHAAFFFMGEWLASQTEAGISHYLPYLPN